MLSSNTAELLRISAPEARETLIEWYAALSDRQAEFGHRKINGRAWRAELKRMDPPYGVMMCEGYDILQRTLSKQMSLSPIHQLALALFVSVAVHIKCHNPNRSFAAQLGEHINSDKPCLSALRFERLQKATNPELLSQLLIRAIKIRGTDGVNILSLADSLFLWMEEWQRREEHLAEPANPFVRNRIRWASEYLSAAQAS